MANIEIQRRRDSGALAPRQGRLFNIWSPFEDFFREFGSDLMAAPQRGFWAPVVDIHETSDELVLTAELPGLEQKDVTINLDNNVLSIRGERKFEEEKQDKNYHLVERSYGVFQRSFTLPGNVKADQIKANM